MTATDFIVEKQKFTLALCAEHLDEASFLYDQIRHILTAPSGPWPGAQRYEQRLGAHLNALSMESESSFSAWENRKNCADPGELYATIRICLQNNRIDRVDKIIDGLAPDEEEKMTALCDALLDEASFHPQKILDILAAHPTHTRMIAKVGGHARLKETWSLVEPGKRKPAGTLAMVLRLAGRIHEKSAFMLLKRSLGHEDRDVALQAALALLRMGNRDAVLDHCRSYQSPLLALGLAGGPFEAAFLIRLAQSGPLTRDLLTGLGLLGDISALPILMARIQDQELSETCARALELITGAGIEEYIFIPDPIDKKALFKEELEKYMRGEDPYPPGKAPGVTIIRLCQKPDAWRNWMEENKQRFIPGTRYRNGKPFSPRNLLENMQSETCPRFLRQLAYEEMVIRYKKDFPFETDRPASFQKEAMEKYDNWLKKTDESFQKGQWYFAGRLMT